MEFVALSYWQYSERDDFLKIFLFWQYWYFFDFLLKNEKIDLKKNFP